MKRLLLLLTAVFAVLALTATTTPVEVEAQPAEFTPICTRYEPLWWRDLAPGGNRTGIWVQVDESRATVGIPDQGGSFAFSLYQIEGFSNPFFARVKATYPGVSPGELHLHRIGPFVFGDARYTESIHMQFLSLVQRCDA